MRLKRKPVIIFLALIFLLFQTSAMAYDTITLKNGRVIIADTAREENGKVRYTIGDNEYAISRTLVESITEGGARPEPAVLHGSAPEFIVPTPPVLLQVEQDIISKVLPNGELDIDALNAIETGKDVQRSAAANYVAAHNAYNHHEYEKSLQFLERARNFMPQNDLLMDDQASVLVHLGRNKEAAILAENATRIAPNAAMGFTLLGFAYFNLDRSKEAASAWKRSLELQPDDKVKEMLDKVQRELATEGGFKSEASGHFNMRYEGAAAPAPLRKQILDALERHFDDLVRDLGYMPNESIPVILYTGQQYFDVTRAPSWSGALNDGKLRIPIQGITSVDTEFLRILKHELTHSFINQMTRGRCPTWLNEGVAQMEEPRSVGSEAHQLALIYRANRNVPLNQLEGGFTSYSGIAASMAYLESLAAVEYIRDIYSMSSVSMVLKRIGEGMSTEAALRAAIHSGYAALDQELGARLVRSYGN